MIQFIKKFIDQEYVSGLILILAALAAMIAVNSPLEAGYIDFLHTQFSLHFGTFNLQKSVLHWINDGLMAIFFLLVGIEIKRELLEGELKTLNKALLPIIAAVGGMIVPSLIFVSFNYHDALALRGWAIPSATDIAFALGILALFSSRIPFSVKVFLMALAILDDLGAIIIIALFYTSTLSWISLGLAAVLVVGLVTLNRNNVTSFTPYALLGFFLWLCVLQSGVHATLAGVILALTYPIRDTKHPKIHLAHDVEIALIPWVNYAVLPLFAFANAGIPFDTVTTSVLFSSIPIGIMLGLFIGKPIGVLGACWIAIRSNLCKLPAEMSWKHLYAVALLCGVGFTMSLFIGTLAYENKGLYYAEVVRLGVLLGSLLSAIAGSLYILCYCPPLKKTTHKKR